MEELGFFPPQLAPAYSSFLQEKDATSLVTDLLKYVPFIADDPPKVSAGMQQQVKGEMELDILDNVQVLKAVEEEFDIPDHCLQKFQLMAYLMTTLQSVV